MPPIVLDEEDFALADIDVLLEAPDGSNPDFLEEFDELEEDLIDVDDAGESPTLGQFKLVELVFEKDKVLHRKRRYFEAALTQEEIITYLDTIHNILEENSPEAHPRRHTGAVKVPSINTTHILKQLKLRIPDIMAKMPKITPNQIRYLFLAPRRGTRAAKRYWGLISARIARGSNSLHEDHEQVLLSFHSSRL